MLVLGIETSCDETGLALVADGRAVLGSQLASSLKHHQRYGGVVPEIASRAHVELLTVELENLLVSCRISPRQIDRIAVTYGPGLAGALLVGVAAAKGLALAWDKPLVAVNHLQAHLYAALMERPDWPMEELAIGLVISGGHTALVRMEGIGRFELLGQTQDDAVGEAFDKVSRLLGLGFPGGPEIERVGRDGDPQAFRFSVPRIKKGSPYDFSLSGMKTAVLYRVQEETKTEARSDMREAPSAAFIADMAASFQSAIVEQVLEKTLAACREHGILRLVLGGGVVANRRLRERFEQESQRIGMKLAFPSLGLCTDNGAMVGGLGCHREVLSPADLTAVPDLRLEAIP